VLKGLSRPAIVTGKDPWPMSRSNVPLCLVFQYYLMIVLSHCTLLTLPLDDRRMSHGGPTALCRE
jgi:hypothetical protein